MHGTKETFVIAASGLILAMLFSGLPVRHAQRLMIPAAIAVCVSAVLFSCAFQYPRGIADSYLTYLHYFGRAGGEGSAGAHVYPPYHYLRLLFWYHVEPGRIWTELPVALLCCASLVYLAVRRTQRGEQFLFTKRMAVYTLFTATVYSLIPYKTPWCVLTFLLGILLLSAVGAAELIRPSRPRGLRLCALLGLLAIVSFSAWQAWLAAFVEYESPSNPYAYSPTTSDVPKLAEAIREITAADNRRFEIPLQVLAPDADYWPLPWYLRQWSHVGWHATRPDHSPAPIIVCHASQQAEVAKWIYQDAAPGEQFLYVPVPNGRNQDDWQLRPGVALRLFVRFDLWEAAGGMGSR